MSFYVYILGADRDTCIKSKKLSRKPDSVELEL